MSRPQSAKAATAKTVNGPRGSDLGRIGPQATTADNSEQLKGWRAHFAIHPAANFVISPPTSRPTAYTSGLPSFTTAQPISG